MFLKLYETDIGMNFRLHKKNELLNLTFIKS